MFFIILILLSLAGKSFESNCGLKLFNVYHSEQNTTCYYSQETDDLPLVDEEAIPAQSIFFIDPSCKGGLNIREACSVEAAAKTNPNRHVNVFFAGPVKQECLESEPLASLQTYNNIHLYRISVDDFSNGTGLHHLLRNLDIDGGSYPMLYALDLLKFITLYKFDGIYLDLDMLTTRSFDELPNADNWVGIADHSRGMLSAAIFGASQDSVGRKFAYTLIRLLNEEMAQDLGGFNLMKSAVESFCGVIPFEKTRKGLSFTCHGLVLYASKFFSPIPCESSGSYFSSDLDINNITRSFSQHLCSSVTFRKNISKESAYAKLMSKFCPKVFQHLGNLDLKETLDEERARGNVNDLEDPDYTSRTEPTTRKPRKWYYEVQ